MIQSIIAHGPLIELATKIVSSLTALVAIFTLGLGVAQFRINQRWKSNEFIAKEMHDFIDDDNTREIISMFDYRKKRFVTKFAGKDIIITTYQDETEIPTVFDGSYHVSLSRALDPRPREEIPFAEEIVRDKIDLYFSSLERFAIFANSGLYSRKKLYGFIKYHVDILNGLKKHSHGYHRNLYCYLTWYNFDLAVNLLKSYPKSKTSRKLWSEASRKAKGNTLPDDT